MQKYFFLFKFQQPPLKNLTYVYFLTVVFTSAPRALYNGGTSFLALEAFDADNALLFSGICKIRYQKGLPTVPNMRAVLKKASYGTRRVFRGPPCSKQASGVQKRYSVPETPSYGTRFQRRETADSADCGQPSAAPNTSSKARNSRLRYAPLNLSN